MALSPLKRSVLRMIGVYAVLIPLVSTRFLWPPATMSDSENLIDLPRTRTSFSNHTIDARESFSTCLMACDDNHRLVEWLAYHWFLLPLRHLVVLSDSKSRTSPEKILERWRPYMEVELWNDDDIMDPHLRAYSKPLENSTRPGDGWMIHVKRQEAFYKRCAIHLQRQNRTWVSFTDVDEYVVINEDIVPDSWLRMQQPGAILRFIHDIQTHDYKNAKHYRGRCISTYRTLFGATESTQEEISKDVPSFLDPRSFDTLRWRYHQNYSNYQHGKVFADVSRIPSIEKKGFKGGLNGTKRVDIHRFLPLCWPPIYYPRAYLRIHHYLGSWESYSYRPDRRKGGVKNREAWAEQAVAQDGGATDEARPWIRGFAQQFSEVEAKRLLRGAGLPSTYKNTDTGSWAKLSQELW